MPTVNVVFRTFGALESGSTVDVLEPLGGKFRPGNCSEGHAPQGRCILHAGAKRKKKRTRAPSRKATLAGHALPTPDGVRRGIAVRPFAAGKSVNRGSG